jgi:NAD(P)-dependent dehydrogenase (short-subunit alcohol dehydrogenase family)
LTDASRHSGRSFAISGGTSGIGLACARRLLEEGAAVWVTGTSPESTERARAELPGLAGASVCDVADEGSVASAFEAIAGALGRLDGAFVNAGIDGQGAEVPDIELAHLRRVIDVNVVGAFLFARAALALMGDGTSLVFNASINATRPEPGFADYNLSKAAVASLAKTMALELAPRHIAVTAVCAGYIRTPMTAGYLDDPGTSEELLGQIPAGRFGKPEEVAGLVSFLLDPEAAYMTGSLATIDGGRSV